MNCDNIARSYRWLEYCAFGRQLEKYRFYFLNQMRECKRALLLGDGDGRFAVRLASANKTISIDVIEQSSRMIALASQRLRRAGLESRVRLIRSNILEAALHSGYDLVVSNFFLDCFSTPEVAAVIHRVGQAANPDATWMVTEFQQPANGWRALHARIWLRTMYTFFRVTTGLRTTSLPEYETPMQAAGFRLCQAKTSATRLIASELWRRG